MRNRFLGAVCIVLLWGSCRARAELRAGVARVDITPKTHEPLWGFEDRTDPSTGTLDPLYARVLVLEAGGKRIAIVAVDLGRSFGESSLDYLNEVVGKSSGISCLLLPTAQGAKATGSVTSWAGHGLTSVSAREQEWDR